MDGGGWARARMGWKGKWAHRFPLADLTKKKRIEGFMGNTDSHVLIDFFFLLSEQIQRAKTWRARAMEDSSTVGC